MTRAHKEFKVKLNIEFMKKVITICFTLSFFLSCSNRSPKPNKSQPVNPNASKEAKELLNYIYSIKGKKILSGQHNYGGENCRSTDSVISFTGKTPLIWGSDIADVDHAFAYKQDVIDEAVKWHNKGAIITLMSHQSRPFDEGPVDFYKNIQGDFSEKQWNEMLTPGTEMHQLWLNKIDTVAYYLKQLRDKNVPVLWRPYHEMNGIWFWWGNRQGEEGYIKLWKMLYDRYVNYHKLNNLIWVWNANGPRDKENDEAYDYNLFFPGLEYVDILATDIYNYDYKESHYDDLLKLAKGKPIALGEIGKIPSKEILEQQPEWCWFMIWARYVWQVNTKDEIKEFYNLPQMISLR